MDNENKKILPNYTWLKKNGYRGIYRCMRKHPELFSNFEFLKIFFLSFIEAKKFVRKLGLKNNKEWREYCKSGDRPDNIPYKPDRTYKDKGWVSWGDWLGTGYVYRKDFLPFKEARKFAISLQLKNQKEWAEYCKSGDKPDNIPVSPSRIYKDKGWISWGDFSGTGYVNSKDRVFLSFEEARDFVRSLNLKGQNEWREYCKSGKKPNNIPTNPNVVYEDKGWNGEGDFLGTGNINSKDRVFLPFKEARKFVRSLGLKNNREWRKYCKSEDRPDNIPAHSDRTYKNKGWISWYDWLGNR